MILCKHCGGLATYNSHFGAYICETCSKKNVKNEKRQPEPEVKNQSTGNFLRFIRISRSASSKISAVNH